MAVLLALLSSLLWGVADFLGGTASRRLPAFAVVGWAQLVGLVAAAVVCVAVGAFGVADLQAAGPWAVAAGLAGLGALVCFYAALASGRMGVVAPITALGVVVPVIAGVLDGERPGALQALGLVVAIIGVVLASGPELEGRAGSRPLGLALLAAVGFGFVLTFVAEGSATSVPLTLLVMRVTTVGVVVVVALAARSVGGVRSGDLPLLATIGIGEVAANLTFAIASTWGLLSLVAVAGSLYPVVTVLLARFVLHERLVRIQYVGVVAAMLGVALIAAGGA